MRSQPDIRTVQESVVNGSGYGRDADGEVDNVKSKNGIVNDTIREMAGVSEASKRLRTEVYIDIDMLRGVRTITL